MSRHQARPVAANGALKPRVVYPSAEGLPATVDLGELPSHGRVIYSFTIKTANSFHLGHGVSDRVLVEGSQQFHGAGRSKIQHEVRVQVVTAEPGPFSDSVWLSQVAGKEHQIHFTGQVLASNQVPKKTTTSKPSHLGRILAGIAVLLLVPLALLAWSRTSHTQENPDSNLIPEKITKTDPPPNEGQPTEKKQDTQLAPKDVPIPEKTTDSSKQDPERSKDLDNHSSGSSGAGSISNVRPAIPTPVVVKKDPLPETEPKPDPEPPLSDSLLPASLRDKDSNGKNLILLVLTNMDDRTRNQMVTQFVDIRKALGAGLACDDVLVVDRTTVRTSTEWANEGENARPFETGAKGLVETFGRVKAVLDEFGRGKHGAPARTVVLWHSAYCPKRLPADGVPTIDRAQILWSGGQLNDDGSALARIFGETIGKVSPIGPSLDGLPGALGSLLKFPAPAE